MTVYENQAQPLKYQGLFGGFAEFLGRETRPALERTEK